MEELTAEQFMEGMKDWKPAEGFEGRVGAQLRLGHAPEETVGALSRAFRLCAENSYRYIQYIHELATTEELDGKNLLPHVAQLVRLVEALRQGGQEYRKAFREYDNSTRPGLTHDHFDTVYYDAIQNIDLRSLLKKIIDEVEALLRSFALTSSELSSVECVELYEGCIRFHLFLRYLLTQPKFDPEEMWSLLFDVFNQLGEMENASNEPTEDELRGLHEDIRKFKNN